MCNFLSGWGKRDGSILCEPLLDSHNDLALLFGIDDTKKIPEWFAKWELTPSDSDAFLDFDTWYFCVDETETPVWCTEDVQKEWKQAAKSLLQSMVLTPGEKRKIVVGGCWFLAPGARIQHLVGGRVLYGVKADLERANLERANLRGAYLGGADLRGADLGGAYLGGAYLGGADLRGAYLRGAYLGGADLRGADLGGAYLGGADLGGADLREAYLERANLERADLRGADLRGANFGGADLRGADLRGAMGSPCHSVLSGWEIVDNIWRKSDDMERTD